MSSSQFGIAFEGAAFDDGEIDVRDLAPALLALGDVVQAANRALNGERAQASLKMRATAQGSFEALLSVDISLLGALGDLLDAVTANPDRVVAADQLIDLLLKGGGAVSLSAGGAVGLFKVLQWLRGKRPDSVEGRPDGTAAVVHNQTTVVVDRRVLELLNDIPTREAVEDFANKALANPRVEAVRLTEDASEALPRETLRLERADVPALQVPPPVASEATVQTEDREVLLKIITSAFRDGYKWRFSDGGEKPFTADIEDADFVQNLSEGKTSLSANDTLRCLIREIQTLDSDGLRKEIKVLRVIEHIPGARQLRMF